MKLSKKKPTIAEIVKANRMFILVLMMTPIIGMISAIFLISYKQPKNMEIALGAIIFLIVQYGLTIYYFDKKIQTMGETDSSSEEKLSE